MNNKKIKDAVENMLCDMVMCVNYSSAEGKKPTWEDAWAITEPLRNMYHDKDFWNFKEDWEKEEKFIRETLSHLNPERLERLIEFYKKSFFDPESITLKTILEYW